MWDDLDRVLEQLHKELSGLWEELQHNYSLRDEIDNNPDLTEEDRDSRKRAIFENISEISEDISSLRTSISEEIIKAIVTKVKEGIVVTIQDSVTMEKLEVTAANVELFVFFVARGKAVKDGNHFHVVTPDLVYYNIL